MYESKETMAAVEVAKRCWTLDTGKTLREFMNEKPEVFLKALERTAINPDANGFDALVLIAGTFLSLDERLPEFLASFAADVLLGKRKRPTKRGPNKYGNFQRDFKLWLVTDVVAEECGLQRYSRNELSGKTMAAEIVSRAAGYKLDVVIAAYKKFNSIMGVK